MLLPPLERAVLLCRPNRFVAQVKLGRHTVLAHVPNSGRMGELLIEGRPVWVARGAQGRGRATAYDLELVEPAASAGRGLVSVDSRLPPRLIEEALQAGRLAQFQGYSKIEREQRYGDSRLDLVLWGPEGVCYLEAKSCNRVEKGVALFPDAVTQRGARHLAELGRAVHEGHRAAIVFVVQREDAKAFATDPTDPGFAQAFRRARGAGVEAYAFPCRVTTGEITLSAQALPILDENAPEQ